MKISSKQRSGGNNPGPRDWKIQSSFNEIDWYDIDGGTVLCGNDWSSGNVDTLSFPAMFNDPGSSMIYVRWIMTSDTSLSGETVAETGVSKIDDIVISGVSSAGINHNLYSTHINIFS